MFLSEQVYHSAYRTSENLLVCAPTGAGKTNVAMLTLLQASVFFGGGGDGPGAVALEVWGDDGA